MPVMCIIRASRVTPRQYDEVRERVGWEKFPPAGAISHCVAFSGAGAVEVNVWESKALFDQYLESRLQIVLDELGVVFDEVQVLDAYNVAVGGPALEHMLPRPAEPERAPEGRVLAIYRRRSIPAELYESFRARAPLDSLPEGALAHAYGRAGNDVVAIDVWDDPRAMIDFIKGTVIPAVQAEGMDFYWPEIVPLETFVTTPAAKAHERPFTAASGPSARELAPAS